MAQEIKIRHDDFDFRLQPQEYIDIHEKFIQAGLTEIAVIQLAIGDRLKDFKPKLIDYMNTTPNWDIQIHGWNHDDYSKMNFHEILRDMSAGMFWIGKLFHKLPTVWYPPWNCYSEDMKGVAKVLGLKIDNEAYDIAKFIREVKAGTYTGHSVYFHAWNRKEMELFPEMMKTLLLLDKGIESVV